MENIEVASGFIRHPRIYTLVAENELRFTVLEDSRVTLELLDGLAEIFGSEIEQNKIYTFPSGTSVAVFTWQGCTLRVVGTTEATYVTKETLMIIPVNLHACLEQMRINAENNNSRGPISLIVGPTDVGKSTLCQILLNYASRLGRRPLFVDLDVGQGSVSIPGSVSVVPIERPADPVEGYSHDSLAVYFFGHKSPGHNMSLYLLLIKKLGEIFHSRIRQGNRNTRFSGVVINTCGWVRGQGYNAITHAAMSFEVDVLFVVGEDKLYLQLKHDMPSDVKVVYIPKAVGATERSRLLRSRKRDDRVNEYFYGIRHSMNPHLFEVNYSDIRVFKLYASESVSVDPSEVSERYISFEQVPIGFDLMDRVLGLSNADDISEDFMLTNCIGFICVANVNTERNVIAVLSPQPGPLPKKILLLGDIKLTERNG